jgi:hypothetical protein
MGGFGTPTRLPEGSNEGREEGKAEGTAEEVVALLGATEGRLEGASEGTGFTLVGGVLVGWAVEWVSAPAFTSAGFRETKSAIVRIETATPSPMTATHSPRWLGTLASAGGGSVGAKATAASVVGSWAPWGWRNAG